MNTAGPREIAVRVLQQRESGSDYTEDLLARPQETYAETLGFLGLREWQLDDFPEHNKKPYSAIDADVRARLQERYAEPNARLLELLGRDFEWAAEGETASTRARNPRH